MPSGVGCDSASTWPVRSRMRPRGSSRRAWATRGLARSVARSAERQSCPYPSAPPITTKPTTSAMAARRTLARRWSSTARGFLVRDAQQEAQDEEIGDHGATAVADEGQGDPGERDQLERAG